MDEELHPMFQDMLRRTDGWTSRKNESSLDYNFIERHPGMSFAFLTITGLAAFAGDVGNILVSITDVFCLTAILQNLKFWEL